MKLRTGFVSNSSTSSFICLGIKATEEDLKKIWPKWDDDDFDVWEVEGQDDDNPSLIDAFEDGNYIVGEYLSSWSDEDCEMVEIDIQDLLKHSPQVEKVEKLLGKKAKLYAGIQAC